MPPPAHTPKIDGARLHALVLEAVPSLAAEVGAEADAEPHRIMRVLFRHAQQAIRDGDIPAVVNCFRLLRRLGEREEEFDIFVRSAIATSFFNRFDPDDPRGLAIFRPLGPEVRRTLRAPFTYPHSWLRETTITVPGSKRWRSHLTVSREAEAEARFIRQACGAAHFAVVHLRIAPTREEPVICFRSGLPESNDAPLVYLEAVIEGVTQALADRSGEDRGVSHLRVDLLALRRHLVDSREADFVKAASQATEQCLAEAGLVEL